MPELWVPGSAEPSMDRFVDRVHAQIERYTSTHGADRSEVEVELAGGERLTLRSLSAEPGFGFVTLTVHPAFDRFSAALAALWLPWMGKRFDAGAHRGVNRLRRSARGPARVRDARPP